MLTTKDGCAAIVARAEAKGLTFSQLERAAELRPEVVADLYEGTKLPCTSTRRRLALLLGCTPGELLEHPEDGEA